MRVPRYSADVRTRAISAPQASPDAFGAAQGRGLQQLGRGVADVGDAIGEIERKNDEARLKEADIWLSGEVDRLLYNPETGYLSQKGGNAISGRDQARQDLDGLTAAAMRRLGGASPEAQHALSLKARQRIQDAKRRASVHYLSESRVYQTEVSEARISQAARELATGAVDSAAWRDRLATIDRELADQAQLNGWSPEALGERRIKIRGGAIGGAIAARLDTDLGGAAALLREHGDSLEPEARAKLAAGIDQRADAAAIERLEAVFATATFAEKAAALGLTPEGEPTQAERHPAAQRLSLDQRRKLYGAARRQAAAELRSERDRHADTLARLEDGRPVGDAELPAPGSLVDQFGPDAADLEDSYARRRVVNDALQAITGAPIEDVLAQRDAYIADLDRPGDDYRDRRAIAAAFAEAAEAHVKRIASDPAGASLDMDPEAAEIRAAALAAQDPIELGAALRDVTVRAEVAQDAKGVPAPTPLPTADAKVLADKILRVPPEQLGDYLEALQRGFAATGGVDDASRGAAPDRYRAVMAQLVGGGGLPGDVGVMALFSTSPDAVRALRPAATLSMEDARKMLGNDQEGRDRRADIDEAIEAAVEPFANALSADDPDGAGRLLSHQIVETLRKTAYLTAGRSGDATATVERLVADTIEAAYTVVDDGEGSNRILAPAAVSEDTIRAAIEAFDLDEIDTLAARGDAVTSALINREILPSDGFWITNDDSDGVQLAVADGARAVSLLGADGQPIEILFDDMPAMARGAPRPTGRNRRARREARQTGDGVSPVEALSVGARIADDWWRRSTGEVFQGYRDWAADTEDDIVDQFTRPARPSNPRRGSGGLRVPDE